MIKAAIETYLLVMKETTTLIQNPMKILFLLEDGE